MQPNINKALHFVLDIRKKANGKNYHNDNDTQKSCRVRDRQKLIRKDICTGD